jgi:hypothetical protein
MRSSPSPPRASRVLHLPWRFRPQQTALTPLPLTPINNFNHTLPFVVFCKLVRVSAYEEIHELGPEVEYTVCIVVREIQRRSPLAVSGIQVGAVVEQYLCDYHHVMLPSIAKVSVCATRVQCRFSLHGYGRYICTLVDQVFDELDMTSPYCIVQRSESVCGNCSYICPVGD